VGRSFRVRSPRSITGTRVNLSSDYFTKVLEDNLKAVVKPQYVDQIPRAIKGPNKSVGHLMKGRAQMDNLDEILDVLGMLKLHPSLVDYSNMIQN
jgi:translation initiation factor RLI1